MRTCLSPSVLSHFPYGRHRLPLAVSQRSLCNILSSLWTVRDIRFRVRVRTTLVCVSPGQVNVLRLARSVGNGGLCEEKKGANGRGRDIRRNEVLQILRSPFLPRWMQHSLLLVRDATRKSPHFASLQLAPSTCVRYIRSPLYYSIIVHTLPPATWDAHGAR